MKKQQRKAFTMIELIFVIVILGIISSIAISKMAVTRDDAMVTKGRSQVAAIRNAIALAKSMKLMSGSASLFPDTLDKTSGQLFDMANDGTKLLDYPVYADSTKSKDGHWWKDTTANNYIFRVMKTNIKFKYDKTTGSFDCHGHNTGTALTYCKLLTE